MNFKELHQQATPLLIANVWDVPSALLAERMSFRALGTSSAAIAQMLGYQDGEQMSFKELVYIVERIIHHVNTPLSVDIEGGYSRDPAIVAGHIKQLVALGVVGVNLEDSIVQDGERTLVEANEFAEKLTKIKALLAQAQVSVFLNIRTDTFLLKEPHLLAATKTRIDLYEKAGADGIFIPGITTEADIKEIQQNTTLPLNVMGLPGLPNFTALQHLGVKRISVGNFLQEYMHQQYTQKLDQILSDQSFQSVF